MENVCGSKTWGIAQFFLVSFYEATESFCLEIRFRGLKDVE
jgi:hypothetical protein